MSEFEFQNVAGVAFVLPRFESVGRARKVGSLALWASFGWHRWGIGFFVLEEGLLIQLGPVYFGACHIDRQQTAFDRKEAMQKETEDA